MAGRKRAVVEPVEDAVDVASASAGSKRGKSSKKKTEIVEESPPPKVVAKKGRGKRESVENDTQETTSSATKKAKVTVSNDITSSSTKPSNKNSSLEDQRLKAQQWAAEVLQPVSKTIKSSTPTKSQSAKSPAKNSKTSTPLRVVDDDNDNNQTVDSVSKPSKKARTPSKSPTRTPTVVVDKVIDDEDNQSIIVKEMDNNDESISLLDILIRFFAIISMSWFTFLTHTNAPESFIGPYKYHMYVFMALVVYLIVCDVKTMLFTSPKVTPSKSKSKSNN